MSGPEDQTVKRTSSVKYELISARLRKSESPKRKSDYHVTSSQRSRSILFLLNANK